MAKDINAAIQRVKAMKYKASCDSAANANDLTQSYRFRPDMAEAHKLYAQAARKAGSSFADRFAANGGKDAVAAAREILKLRKSPTSL